MNAELVEEQSQPATCTETIGTLVGYWVMSERTTEDASVVCGYTS
jgi:hypothetical protein